MIRAYDENGNIVEDYERQIYNKAVDDLMNRLCNYCIKQTNRCNKLECPFGTDGCGIIKIAAQLKEQDR